MIDLTGVKHHPALDDIVNVLCARTGNRERYFFQAITAYFFSVMASNMRANVRTEDRGEVPVNCYAIAMAESGFGKGYSVTIFEQEILQRFRARFTGDTISVGAEKHLWKIANKRAARDGTGQQEEFDKAEKEFRSLGPFPFVFDSGTAPAVKQLRNKLLMASCGSINFQMDELGSNLEGNTEVLNVYLELFDQGLTKQKLTKNTKENVRIEEVDGKTPANMLLFGTPDKVFDGHSIERAFMSFLEIGYARRCIFGEGRVENRILDDDDITEEKAEELFEAQKSAATSPLLEQWSKHFHDLADPAMLGWTMDMAREASIKLMQYKLSCERAADKMANHQSIEKAEMAHRYFKALKLAGAYAFVDQSPTVELDHLLPAILLVEESGEAFRRAMDRPTNYEKLARFIAESSVPVTHPMLTEKLPFYKQSQAIRNDLMTMAIAWGYSNHIIIKKTFADGVERFHGEALKETSLDAVKIAYSDDWAYNYELEEVPFKDLHLLTQAEGMHWTNHGFKNNHRMEENALPGFNLVVIDIDDGVTLEAVHELMRDYTFMTYTTKRHSDGQHRFRLILPINYQLKLESDAYKEFMNSLMEWLPFPSDEAANQRSKKWMSHADGEYHYNEGQLLDALPFIPSTSRNVEHNNAMKELQSLDNLERWFAHRIASGNRNNQMIKFALALVDSGMDLMEVTNKVHAFNKKLSNPLAKDEIDKTIMVTVAKRYQKSSQSA